MAILRSATKDIQLVILFLLSSKLGGYIFYEIDERKKLNISSVTFVNNAQNFISKPKHLTIIFLGHNYWFITKDMNGLTLTATLTLSTILLLFVTGRGKAKRIVK